MRKATYAEVEVGIGPTKAATLATPATLMATRERGNLPTLLGKYHAEATSVNPIEHSRMPSQKYGIVVSPNSLYMENKASDTPVAYTSCGTNVSERFNIQMKRNGKSVAAPEIGARFFNSRLLRFKRYRRFFSENSFSVLSAISVGGLNARILNSPR